MKTRLVYLVLLGGVLTGCGSPDDGYGLMWGIASCAVTGYETVKEGLMKHACAKPGTAYPDFEAAIEKVEKIKYVPAEFVPSSNFTADHSFLFKYEGERAMYYGRFVKKPNDPSDSVPTFSAGEITNLSYFVAKLKRPSDPVSACLISRFSKSARQAIADFPESRGDEKSLEPLLIKELNAIVLGPLIYDENRFREVTLRPATRNVLKVIPNPPRSLQGSREQMRIVLNRMLLADAYPSNLPMKRWNPRLNYVAIKF